MHLRTEDRLNPEDRLFNQRLRRTVKKIQECMDLSADTLSDILGMDLKSVEEVQKGSKIYPIRSLYMLSRFLHLSLERLLSGDIDFRALALQHAGDSMALPEKYANPSHHLARAAAVSGVLSYLKTSQGEEYAQSTLNHMQIKPAYLHDPQKFVSPHLLIDLLGKMKMDRYDDSHFFMTGTLNYWILSQLPIGKVLQKMGKSSEVYRALHEDLMEDYYDHIFRYRLTKLSENGCTISVSMREESQDRFSSKLIANREVCLYKQGAYSAFNLHADQRIARVFESKCMYEGDSECVYHIDWH